jgi:hypothetical protein
MKSFPLQSILKLEIQSSLVGNIKQICVLIVHQEIHEACQSQREDFKRIIFYSM